MTEDEYDRIAADLARRGGATSGAIAGAKVAAGIAAFDTAADIADNDARARYLSALASGVPKLIALLWGYPLRFFAACFVGFWALVLVFGNAFVYAAYWFFAITGHQMMPAINMDPYFRQHVNYAIDRLYDTPYDGAGTDNTHLTATLTNTTDYDISEFQIDCNINYSNSDIGGEPPTLVVLNGGAVPAHQSRTYSVTVEKDGNGEPTTHQCNLHSVTPKQEKTWLPVGWG